MPHCERRSSSSSSTQIAFVTGLPMIDSCPQSVHVPLVENLLGYAGLLKSDLLVRRGLFALAVRDFYCNQLYRDDGIAGVPVFAGTPET